MGQDTSCNKPSKAASPVAKWRNRLVWASVAFSLLSFVPGMGIDARSQLAIASALVGVSGAVLAISGLWAGLVFPETLRSVLTRRESQADPLHLLMTQHLRRTIVMSGVVLLGCLISPPLVAALKALPIPNPAIPWLLGLGFSGLVGLTCIQGLALLQLLALGMEVGELEEVAEQEKDAHKRREARRGGSSRTETPRQKPEQKRKSKTTLPG